MTGTTVERGMPPTLPFAITSQDQQTFMNQLSLGLTRRLGTGSSSSIATSESSGTGGTSISGQGVNSLGLGFLPMVVPTIKVQTTAPAPPRSLRQHRHHHQHPRRIVDRSSFTLGQMGRTEDEKIEFNEPGEINRGNSFRLPIFSGRRRPRSHYL